MEDYLSQDPFAGQAARLVERCRSVSPHPCANEHNALDWLDAAETCVLARIDRLRIPGGLPRHHQQLRLDERIDRLEKLLGLWAEGCTLAVDECLFADILNRRRPK